MSIPTDQQQLQQRQLNAAIKKKNRRNDVVTPTMLAAARQRSTSMLSLHWGGFPKRISLDDLNLSWIPSEVKIYPTNNRRRINTTSNNTKLATTTPVTPPTMTNNFNNNSCNSNNNKTILVVVGVPDTYKDNELSTTARSNPKCFSGSLYSHTQFLYFQQNLVKTIQLCRAQQNTGIIHISNSSSSGSGLPKTAVTKRHSLRPQHQKDNEIFISKPIWSTSGNILLLDALEKLSSSSQQQQQQQRGNSIVDDKTTKKTKDNTTTVLVCGLVTSVCVLHSAMVCSEAGYKTYIIEDSCADRDRIRHDHAISLAEDTQKLEVISTIIPSLPFKPSRYSI